ncbi:hypothetical protein [Simkania sp.]|uniref:hypothetical protein n=1 Tax=Simkania sp. TaxID=34094 RepID=UPI003B51D3CC
MKTESKEVHYFFPFHHGVDPAFSEDGTTFHYTRCSSYIDFAIVIASYALDLLAFLFTYLHPSCKERAFRKLLFQASITEQRWHHYTAEPCVQNVSRPDSYLIIQYYEHEFCEKLGEVAQKVLDVPASPQRLFPCELLYPLHGLVAHPDSSDTSDFILKSEALYPENSMIARMVHLGYNRLRINSFSECPELLTTHYVSHKEFIQKTETARNELIKEFRQIRITLQSPFTLFFNRRKLVEDLEAFYEAWEAYRYSHELLREIASVYKERDYRKRYYEALEDIRYNHLFFRSAYQVDQSPEVLELYDRVCCYMNLQDPLGWWIDSDNFSISNDNENIRCHLEAMSKEQALQTKACSLISGAVQKKIP